MCADNFHACLGLRLYSLALGSCRGFGLTDFLLPHQQILLGVLLLHFAEVRVIVRGDYAADVKLRHGQTVVRKACVDALFQCFGQAHQFCVDFQHIDAAFFNSLCQIAFDLRHNHGAEKALGVGSAKQLFLCQRTAGADQLYQQLAAVNYADAELAAGAKLHVQTAGGVKQAHFAVGAPFCTHLGSGVDKVYFRVERTLSVGGQLIEFFQQGQLLGLQRVAARAEQVQRLPIAEENRLLTFMYNQLGAVVKILDGMFPDQCFVVALILDDTGKTVFFDLLFFDLLCHIVYEVTNRAGVACRTFGSAQPHPALGAGEFHHLVLLCHRIDGFVADRAFGAFAHALVKQHHIAAVRALAACHFVGAHMDGITAGAVDFLAGKKARAPLGIATAVGAFNYKF